MGTYTVGHLWAFRKANEAPASSEDFLLLNILVFLLLLLLFAFQANPSNALESRQAGDPIIIQVIQLDHANAENLASVLAPLFSKEVQIIAYSPTNSLIIKGKKSLVKKLVKIIKGNHYPNQ